MTCEFDPTPLQPPLRTEEFETLFHLLKLATTCQDLNDILVYFIDNVDASVLPHLAEQFDLLGYKGLIAAPSIFEQRELLKRVVSLKHKMGVPSGIFAMFNLLQISGVTIYENPCLIHNGTVRHDGSENHTGRMWDRFIYRLSSAPSNLEIFEILEEVINVWKPARSSLFNPFKPLLHNGTVTHNGAETHDGVSSTIYSKSEVEEIYGVCATNIVDDSNEPPIFKARLQFNNELQLTNDLQLRDDII